MSRQSSTSSLSRSNSSQRMDDGGESGDGNSQPPLGMNDRDEKQTAGSVTASVTQDAVRLKCRELLAAALKAGGWLLLNSIR